ncbi:MAG: pyridoxamine 5'-phosphate oxidase family protein [Oscillospiraceae bacterium]|nr:pyridoxamine 5'-phosphate oxidase family protein [Oscillospiraceae bacterium]
MSTFRPMRRSAQQLTDADAEEILMSATSGVLSVFGDGGYPYGVPLSYTYNGGKIYFHCAKSGHKLDAVRNCNKASFCVIAQDEVVPEKYTTLFRSVIAFGRIREITDDSEMRRAIELLARRYNPMGSEEDMNTEIDKEYDRLCMLEMTVEHMTGKEAIEIVRNKKIKKDQT